MTQVNQWEAERLKIGTILSQMRKLPGTGVSKVMKDEPHRSVK